MANEVTINGTIYDLYAVTSKLNINYDGIIYRDLHAITSEINMIGRIGRNMLVSSGNINFTSWDEEAQEELTGLVYGNLEHAPNSQITYPKNEETNESDSSLVVSGEITQSTMASNSIGTTILNLLFSLLATLILVVAVWLILIWIAPHFVEKITNYIPKKLLPATGFGLLGLIVGFVLSVLLLVLTIGTKLGLVLFAIYGLFIMLSIPVLSIAIGSFINSKMKTPSKSKAFGFIMAVSTVIWGLQLIPYAGTVFALIGIVLGFGIIIISFTKKKENV